MDYKSVLEEQIRELQKTQDRTPCNSSNGSDTPNKIALAEQIKSIVELLLRMQFGRIQ